MIGEAQRDERIAKVVAQAAAAQDAIRGNAERRALAVAAAQRAIVAAERQERDSNAAAAAQLVSAVRALRGEGVTVARVAELLQVAVPRVRELIKQANAAADIGGGAG